MKFLIFASIFCMVATEKPNFRQTIPPAYDARTLGWISPIRNEGQCSAAYAFAAVSLVETGYVKKSQSYQGLDLSEQELVNCVNGNYGCNGGDIGATLSYIQSRGLVTESQLGYVSQQQSCQISSGNYKCSKVPVTPSIQAIKAAIMQYGSVAFGVDATSWPNYSSGIKTSQTSEINHYVNLVGWNDTYWIARNCWGTTWGESGYIRITTAGCLYSTTNPVFAVYV